MPIEQKKEQSLKHGSNEKGRESGEADRQRQIQWEREKQGEGISKASLANSVGRNSWRDRGRGALTVENVGSNSLRHRQRVNWESVSEWAWKMKRLQIKLVMLCHGQFRPSKIRGASNECNVLVLVVSCNGRLKSTVSAFRLKLEMFTYTTVHNYKMLFRKLVYKITTATIFFSTSFGQRLSNRHIIIYHIYNLGARGAWSVWFHFVLWHINHCWLFNVIFIRISRFISTNSV